MISGMRKIVTVGHSKAFMLPASVVKGKMLTFAGTDLILIDPTGQTTAEELVKKLKKVG